MGIDARSKGGNSQDGVLVTEQDDGLRWRCLMLTV